MSAYKKSINAETTVSFRKIYATDYDTAWQSVLDALKSSRLDVSNREGGVIITRWADNTAEKNFTDGDGTIEPYMKAQFRFRVNLIRGYYKSRPVIRIAVRKEQLVQRDSLDQLRPLKSDTIEENTLLYRIGRLINIKMRLAQMEKERVDQEVRDAMGSNSGDAEMTPDSHFEEDPFSDQESLSNESF